MRNWGGLKLLRHHVFFLKLRSSPFHFMVRPPQFPTLGYFGVRQEEAEGMGGVRKGVLGGCRADTSTQDAGGGLVTFPPGDAREPAGSGSTSTFPEPLVM